MSKKYKTTTTLVIVESPAKCKKIEKFLGPGYKCIASFGHLRELYSLKNIDIENNFIPTYTIIDNAIKKKQVELLRKEIKAADDILLATDDDREGEAISWHLCQLFNLDVQKTKRIIFHEITENALQMAVKNPKLINMNMVYSQQARQILDLLIGFKISPILWKCIAKNKDNALSAGRCQTPALKIIYDNHQEISNANTKKVYNTTGYFTNTNLPFDLSKQYESEEEMTDFLDGSIYFNHIYSCSSPIKVYKKSPEPFTTSRLQQTASNELHYSPKETMKLCQTLYEGGYITYMRTDSKTYSKEFIENTKEYIIRNYNRTYINPHIDLLTLLENTETIENNENKENKEKDAKKKTKTKKENKEDNNDDLRQEAHEAIRPTNISLFELPKEFDSKEKKMYKLIWENSLESCMADASFYSVTANISAFQNNKFTFTSEQVDFPGWKIVSKKYQVENKEYQYLQTIKKDTSIPYKKICSRVTIKGSKNHYTEARLVQLLEEKGIGRPSTFSSLIDKIQERGYVKKQDIKGIEIKCNDYELENDEIFEVEAKREFGNEKNKLVIQPLGILVIEFLYKYFSEMFDYNYTKEMELSLDSIAKGNIIWQNICSTCNIQLDNIINSLSEKGLDEKLEIKIDDNNTYLVGKYGPVIKCVEEIEGKEAITFKPVKNDVDVSKLQNGDYKIEDIVDTIKNTKSSYILGQHEGNDVILRKGKFGLYISWCDKSKTLKELGNRPIENITFEEVKKYLEEGSNILREVSSNISIRKGPKGDYIFFKTPKLKKPQFFDLKGFTKDIDEDYKTCKIDVLKLWIKDTHNIS